MAKTVGEKIKSRRIELGWSLRELATRMGYANHSTVARVESGAVDLPQSKVAKFAEVMGTSVAYLMDWEQVEQTNDTITDAVVRMRTDAEFLSAVESLLALDSDKLSLVTQMISAFKK